MFWMVTMKLRDAPDHTMRVSAPTKAEAELRAAYRSEEMGNHVERVLETRKSN